MGTAEGERAGDPSGLPAWAVAGPRDDELVPVLDRLTRSAARLADAPAAAVMLADAGRQVLLSAAGLPEAADPSGRTLLCHALCQRVVDAGEPMVAADIRLHPLLGAAPAVGQRALAYAGFPLRRPDGPVLGVFCVLDTRVRQWEPRQLTAAQDMAQVAASQLTLRMAHAGLAATADRLRTVLDTANDAFISLDERGTITAWNAAAQRLFGWSVEQAVSRSAAELLIAPPSRDAYEQALATVIDTGACPPAGQRLEIAAVDRAGRQFPVELTLQAGRGRDQDRCHAFLHDISVRKAAQRELEHERTFLQALLDSLDTGVAACDSHGRLALLNQALQAVLGPGAEKVGPEHWADVFHLYAADGRTPLRSDQVPLTRAFNGERIDDEQIVLREPGVPARRFAVNGRPIDTPDGGRLGAVVALHDITERHTSEALRRVRHAVAQALADADSAEQAATATLAAIAGAFGWTYGEYWQPDGELLHRLGVWSAADRDVSVPGGAAQRPLRRGEGLPGLVWATGEPRRTRDLPPGARDAELRQAGPHDAIGLPVHGGERLVGVLTFHHDTIEEPDPQLLAVLHDVCSQLGQHVERRRADELAHELAAARRDLDRIIDQVNDFVWTLEVLPDAGMRVVFASRNSSGVFGGHFPTDADPAETMRRHVHPDDRGALDTFLHTLADGRSAELECRLLGTDNVVRWLWARGVARHEGDRLFIDGISTNITERRHLAEQREQLLAEQQQHVHRLQELDRMKDELVALVSHELRNPIATIRSYIEMTHDDPDLSDDHRAFADLVDRHSAHLQHLVDDLLDLARLDAGRMSIDARPVSLRRLIDQSINDHRPAADARHLTMNVDLPRHLPAHADPARLRQALDNLLSNAVKYSEEHGHVTVTAHHDDQHATITISDDGIGIPPEQYPHLFERFFRASTATNRGIKGTGLGLAITKAIIDAHGGTITAGPNRPRGTTFTVRLPTTL
ncbi:sensor histidine kinase [Actinoplanes teichomyceticus]|uniref:Sensor-like histidine kinase SenX3 n=1 Tax=Actinoplanes teichomyceticus TaxID=1867 RepID=A0A561VIN3_ACTTI|nr:ATP-binding protein [Actinoplanes teichomyceticus]TWG11434.1 PAS domain S-box-containing protein [Actinoplanes teichomyceticus]GIF15753.1 hypothetical protein Ate01nite_57850 [Actinoplanes teichomyceticus]